jgi:hypothetical protein
VRTVFVAALLASVVSIAACGKPGSGEKADTSLYLEPGKLFSCRAPADWRVLEKQGGAQRVTFIGPASGAAPYSAAITAYFYEKGGSAYGSAQDYARAQALLPGRTGPLVFKTWKGLAVFEFSADRSRPALHGSGQMEERRELSVLIPSPSGLYAFVLTAPAGSYARIEPVFRGLIDSLDLGSR